MNHQKSVAFRRSISNLLAGEPSTQGAITGSTPTRADSLKVMDSRVQAVGFRVIRYGLALVIAWIGFMKFTSYEANGIRPLVANSPLLAWMYHLLSVRQFSVGLGVVEIGIAILIAL